MDKWADLEPVPLFITPSEIETLERLINTLKAMDQMRRHDPEKMSPPRGVVQVKLDPCKVYTLVQVCDAKIVVHNVEYCRFVPPVYPYKLKKSSGFCLCNDTTWEVKVRFEAKDGSGLCAGIAQADQSFVLAPGATRKVHTAADSPPNCECNVIIERMDAAGVWQPCSGNGGGPDMIVDPPSGP